MPHRKSGQFQAVPRVPVHWQLYVCVVGWGVGVVPGAQSMFSPISRLKGRHFPLLAAESQRAQREPEESPCFCLLYGEVGLLSSLWLGKE